MANPKILEQKQAVIDEITENVKNSASFILLENNGLTGNCAMINHTAGSTTITLKQGTYIINFNCDATSATTGALSFQLYNNDIAVPSALATNTIATENNISNFGFTTFIKVLCSCPAIDNTARLTIRNTGANPAIISNVAVTVHKQ